MDFMKSPVKFKKIEKIKIWKALGATIPQNIGPNCLTM